MKCISIVGARPQFIKLAALHRVLIKQAELKHIIVHTGQHYDQNMSDIFFSQLEIPRPDFNLKIPTLPFGAALPQMRSAIENILNEENPSIVIVFGDTNSTLAGALAANNTGTPLAHVEAGVRSFNPEMPEEYNRIETDKVSNLLFCPSEVAIKNLSVEKLTPGAKIVFTGDIMYDAIRHYSLTDYAPSPITETILRSGKFVLATIHRQSNLTSSKILNQITQALNTIAGKIHVVMPVHPRTRDALLKISTPVQFTLVDPLGYLDMLKLLNHCQLVLTDSGGLQKEAFYCKKMCVTIRNETEWTELVKAGGNIVAGTSVNGILVAFAKCLTCEGKFTGNYFGNGNAAEIMTTEILNYRP